MIEFRRFSDFPRGTMLALLRDGYSFDGWYERDWLDNWRAADAFFYDHIDIADKCGFITALDGAAIGFICWDPRHAPDYVELGHNCIASAQKGRGYGGMQLREAVRRMSALGAARLRVTTDEQLLAAQRNYESAGFRLTATRANPVNPDYAGRLLDYEMPVN